MKNKIKQISKGDFKLEQPDIRFSDTQIRMSVGEGEVYQGSFLIENQKGGNIRGLVYPSSFRVHCVEQGFDGNPVKINYTYDATGMLPGQIDKGKFTVVCNGGEFDLSYVAIIEKPYVMTAYGKVQSLLDYKRLAQKDFSEAHRLFRSRQFYDVLKYEDKRIQNLYDNMRKWSLDEAALEEFLVGTKQKEKIFLTIPEEAIQLCDVLDETKSYLSVSKNTWGYVPISIHAEGEFIELSRKEISTDDFVGNRYRLEYVIKQDKLHTGRNYGKIFISTPYETLGIDVNVHQSSVRKKYSKQEGILAGELLREYLQLIAGKISVSAWLEKEMKGVVQLGELSSQKEYYTLLQSHIYLRARKEEEARWILENSDFSNSKEPKINAYYMFLMALLKKETLYTNKTIEELNRLYLKYPYSWELLCMLVNLDSRYRDYSERLRVLERQFFNGSNQILLYAEAYICFQERVSTLRKLESFEIQVMNFAAKYKIITKEVALHFADLVCRQKKYKKRLVIILKNIYELYEEPSVLQAICMQLIKGNVTDSDSFKWYQKAVEQEMKIAQLYEYYMMSIPLKRVEFAFPKIVYLYFQHGITLDYKRTALLYENILMYENAESEIYKAYYEQMKTFAWEQLMKRQINDSLRLIYSHFINETDLTFDAVDALYDVCNAYRVTTAKDGIKYVLVIEKDGMIRQRVPYQGGEGAKVYLYNKDARIVWEADNGIHFVDSIPYETQRLFYEMQFIKLCKKRMGAQAIAEKEMQTIPISFENLKRYGMNEFEQKEIFLLCSKRIREQGQIQDDFLMYLCLELLKDGFYDKASLNYMAQFYCGATSDMKSVWKKAREYNVKTYDLAERIITQMLFTEHMFCEEAIFDDYYDGKPYFRLKQAYLAYVSRLYIIHNRIISERIVQMMLHELKEGEYLADICKAAILKYYAGRKMEFEDKELIKKCLCELSEKHLVFPFYLKYPLNWLKEVQLYDKVMVLYQGKINGRVRISYEIRKENEHTEIHTETLYPMYENIYVKEFVLYENEILQYYFEEKNQEEQITSEQLVCSRQSDFTGTGKYELLNRMENAVTNQLHDEMLKYKQEEYIANTLFLMY